MDDDLHTQDGNQVWDDDLNGSDNNYEEDSSQGYSDTEDREREETSGDFGQLENDNNSTDSGGNSNKLSSDCQENPRFQDCLDGDTQSLVEASDGSNQPDDRQNSTDLGADSTDSSNGYEDDSYQGNRNIGDDQDPVAQDPFPELRDRFVPGCNLASALSQFEDSTVDELPSDERHDSLPVSNDDMLPAGEDDELPSGVERNVASSQEKESVEEQKNSNEAHSSVSASTEEIDSSAEVFPLNLEEEFYARLEKIDQLENTFIKIKAYENFVEDSAQIQSDEFQKDIYLSVLESISDFLSEESHGLHIQNVASPYAINQLLTSITQKTCALGDEQSKAAIFIQALHVAAKIDNSNGFYQDLTLRLIIGYAAQAVSNTELREQIFNQALISIQAIQDPKQQRQPLLKMAEAVSQWKNDRKLVQNIFNREIEIATKNRDSWLMQQIFDCAARNQSSEVIEAVIFQEIDNSEKLGDSILQQGVLSAATELAFEHPDIAKNVLLSAFQSLQSIDGEYSREVVLEDVFEGLYSGKVSRELESEIIAALFLESKNYDEVRQIEIHEVYQNIFGCSAHFNAGQDSKEIEDDNKVNLLEESDQDLSEPTENDLAKGLEEQDVRDGGQESGTGTGCAPLQLTEPVSERNAEPQDKTDTTAPSNASPDNSSDFQDELPEILQRVATGSDLNFGIPAEQWVELTLQNEEVRRAFVVAQQKADEQFLNEVGSEDFISKLQDLRNLMQGVEANWNEIEGKWANLTRLERAKIIIGLMVETFPEAVTGLKGSNFCEGAFTTVWYQNDHDKLFLCNKLRGIVAAVQSIALGIGTGTAPMLPAKVLSAAAPFVQFYNASQVVAGVGVVGEGAKSISQGNHAIGVAQIALGVLAVKGSLRDWDDVATSLNISGRIAREVVLEIADAQRQIARRPLTEMPSVNPAMGRVFAPDDLHPELAGRQVLREIPPPATLGGRGASLGSPSPPKTWDELDTNGNPSVRPEASPRPMEPVAADLPEPSGRSADRSNLEGLSDTPASPRMPEPASSTNQDVLGQPPEDLQPSLTLRGARQEPEGMPSPEDLGIHRRGSYRNTPEQPKTDDAAEHLSDSARTRSDRQSGSKGNPRNSEIDDAARKLYEFEDAVRSGKVEPPSDWRDMQGLAEQIQDISKRADRVDVKAFSVERRHIQADVVERLDYLSDEHGETLGKLEELGEEYSDIRKLNTENPLLARQRLEKLEQHVAELEDMGLSTVSSANTRNSQIRGEMNDGDLPLQVKLEKGWIDRIHRNLGEAHGRQQLKQEGLERLEEGKDWVNPNAQKSNSPGFDDIARDPQSGKLVLVEYKGGSSSKLKNGQMSRQWVQDKIDELRAYEGNNDIADELQSLLDGGELRGKVYTTRVTSDRHPRPTTTRTIQYEAK